MNHDYFLSLLTLVVVMSNLILGVIAIVAISHHKDALAEKATRLMARLSHDAMSLLGRDELDE